MGDQREFHERAIFRERAELRETDKRWGLTEDTRRESSCRDLAIIVAMGEDCPQKEPSPWKEKSGHCQAVAQA